MTERDIESYCSLFKTVFSQAPWYEQWETPLVRKRIERTLRRKGTVALIAEAESGLIACLNGWQLFPGLFYVDQLFIDPGKQGQGLGRLLLAELEGQLTHRGLNRLTLLTRPEVPAACFYQKLGFRLVLKPLLLGGKNIFAKSLKDQSTE